MVAAALNVREIRGRQSDRKLEKDTVWVRFLIDFGAVFDVFFFGPARCLADAVLLSVFEVVFSFVFLLLCVVVCSARKGPPRV